MVLPMCMLVISELYSYLEALNVNLAWFKHQFFALVVAKKNRENTIRNGGKPTGDGYIVE